MKKIVTLLMMASAAQMACAQTAEPALTGPGLKISAPAAVPGPVAPASEEVVKVLTMLQDRKETLKDFTGKINYSVYHPVADDTSGKQGTIDFLNDPNKGPIFSVDFTVDTDELGKPKRLNHQQVIFDGQDVTTKDFTPKLWMRQNMLPAGAKPGAAVTMNGPMTLPIGLQVKDVLENFDATVVKGPGGSGDAASGSTVVLRLVPRPGKKFDYRQLDVTVDMVQQLPIKLVQTEKNKDVTTITLTEIAVNSGKARMEDPKAPAGWTERKM